MAEPVQTLAHGQTPSQKWGGSTGAPMIAPPESIMGLALGYPGSGKTDFLWSNPDAFVFNLDRSSTAVAPRAVVWPYFEGGSWKADGAPFQFTWASFQKKIDFFKELAKQNKPRPKTLVFDTIFEAIPLLQTYIAEKAQKTHWKQLDGRQAWGELYDTLNSLMLDLHNLGYGVWFSAHLIDVEVVRSETLTETVPEINLSEKLHGFRLLPAFEFVGVVEKSEEVQLVQDHRFPDDPRAKVSKKVSVVRLTNVTSSLNLNKGLKCRVDSFKGPIVLPRGNGWSVFREAYFGAASNV